MPQGHLQGVSQAHLGWLRPAHRAGARRSAQGRAVHLWPGHTGTRRLPLEASGSALGAALGGTVMGLVLADRPIHAVPTADLAVASAVALWLATALLVVALLAIPRERRYVEPQEDT